VVAYDDLVSLGGMNEAKAKGKFRLEGKEYVVKDGDIMHVLNIVTSPRKDQSASRALVDAFLREYMTQADGIVIDTLNVWQEWLPEFDAETINAK